MSIPSARSTAALESRRGRTAPPGDVPGSDHLTAEAETAARGTGGQEAVRFAPDEAPVAPDDTPVAPEVAEARAGSACPEHAVQRGTPAPEEASLSEGASPHMPVRHRLRPTVGVRFGVLLIRIYQIYLSPFLGGRCRFHPSCSEYAAEALRTHGLLRGTALAAKRIARCQPLGGSGYDPVPPLDPR